MNIILYHIEGISKEDTLYFESVSDQGNFFHEYEVKRVDDTWYPPFSTDRIKFSSDDLTVTTQVNYLALEDDEKTYYYFITGVEYDADGLIVVTIEMDYIQTFMFNAKLASGIVERKFINRWTNDGKINRNYIRENLSVGNFKFYSYNEHTTINDCWIVFQYANSPQASDSRIVATSDSVINIYPSGGLLESESIYTSNELYVLPMGVISSACSVNGSTKCLNNNQIDAFVLQPQTINAASISTRITNIYMVPHLTFYDPVSLSTTSITGGNLKPYALMDSTSVISSACVLKATAWSFKPWVLTKSFGFAQNYETGHAFVSEYVPALMDENYISIDFGEPSARTTFPLYYSKSDTICLYSTSDITSGSRSYWINTNQAVREDTYGTKVTASVPWQLDLKSDKFEEWNAFNKATLWGQTISGALAVSGNAYSGHTTEAFTLKANESHLGQGRGKSGKFTRSKDAYSETRTATVSESSHASGVTSALDGLNSYLTTQSNNWLAPQRTVQKGFWSSVASERGYVISTRVMKVDDYDQVAKYYHRNGYLVREFLADSVSFSDFLASEVMTRHYYGVLKMAECEVHLEDFVECESITSAIAHRLASGIRLWRTNPDSLSVIASHIGNYYYDNVEIAYL